MSKVKLEIVAKEHKEALKCDKSGLPVVGLEHLIPKQIKLENWDVDVNNTFTKMFRKGNVLFGRRRAYLKKAAYATVDGICSGDITVIEVIPGKIYPELLPFIIQNDDLFVYAVGKSAGSLSPRVKWEQLKNFEFTLPDDLDKQKEIADILWSMTETREAYVNMQKAADELVKSQFIEQFNKTIAVEKGWKVIPLYNFFERPLSGEWGNEDPDGNGIKVIRTTNFTDYGLLDLTEVVTRQIDYSKVEKKILKINDIIIEKSGGSDTKPVGRVVRVVEDDESYLFNNFTSLLRVKDDSINPRFVFDFMFFNYQLDGTRKYENKTTGIHNLKLNDYLNETVICVPPRGVQDEYVKFTEQSDKSKFKLQRSIDELDATLKKILEDNFRVKKD